MIKHTFGLTLAATLAAGFVHAQPAFPKLPETYSFSTSFMSSNCTAPLHLVYLGLLASGPRLGRREVVLLVLLNVHLLLTYPEFLAVVKCFEALQLLVAVARRRPDVWKPLLLVNLTVCLLHPVLVAQKIALTVVEAGDRRHFSIFGDPFRETRTCLGNCLGLRYAHLPLDPLGPKAAAAVALIVLAAWAAGLCVLARRHRLGAAVAFWAGALALLHLLPVLLQGSQARFHGAAKFLLQTYALPLLAVQALCSLRGRGRLAGYAAAAVWAAAAVCADARVFPAAHRSGVVYPYRQMRDTLAQHQEPLAALTPPPGLWVLRLAANEAGLPLVPLSQTQRIWLARAPDAVELAGDSAPPRRVVFEGLVAADPAVLAAGNFPLPDAALEFRPERVLGRVGPQYLCRGRIRYATTAVIPGGVWVTAAGQTCPGIFAGGPRLVVRGDVPGWARLRSPYRFRVAVPAAGWEAEAAVGGSGPFEVAFALPAAAVGRVVRVRVVPLQTFRPSEVDPKSRDTRDIGFMLHAVECPEAPPAADALRAAHAGEVLLTITRECNSFPPAPPVLTCPRDPPPATPAGRGRAPRPEEASGP